MDNYTHDTNKRFKVEPEELIIEEEFFEETGEAEVETNGDCFQYECTPTTSFVSIRKDSVPSILDGQFFQILTVTETTCTALCKLCEPRRKTINGSLKATGNFYDHIKRMHLSYMAEAEIKRGAKRRPRTKKFNPYPVMLKEDLSGIKHNVNLISPLRNDNLSVSTIHLPRHDNSSQEEAFSAIFEFACETMHPTTVVESESFRNLVDVLSGNKNVKISIPASQEIETCILRRLSKMNSLLENHLSTREFVCATADLWKREGWEFVGVCGHTIHPFTFARESFALGFRPVKVDDKCDIAKEISDVLSKYNIREKVRSVVMENIIRHSDLSDREDSLGEILDLQVPDQVRSFSHLLTLVVAVDITSKKVVKKGLPGDTDGERSKEFASVYDRVMNKLSALWNYLKISTRASDFCAEYCGNILPVPNDEWSSRFEAIKIIVETEKLHKIFDQLTLPRGKRFLEKEDLDFLTGYVTVMQPFTTALDILKDAGSFTGTVLPTILSLKCRLEAMSGLDNTESIRILALRSLSERFEMLDLEKSSKYSFILIATIAHPAFKMCLPSEYYEKARESFLGACSAMSEKYFPKTSGEKRKSNSFFSVLIPATTSVDCVTNEGLRYLTDDCEEFSVLERYPWVKKIFLKYNTCLSSSAAVERLLSPANQMLNTGACAAGKHFENCLLLKINEKCKHLY